MNRFLILALTAGLLSPIAAKADFGKADIQGQGFTKTKFAAWCAKRKNNCMVEFLKKGISVDSSSPVPYKRIKDFSFDENHGWGCFHQNNMAWQCPGRAYTFDIFYLKSSGEESIARIIFAKHSTALEFMGALKKSQGKNFNRTDPRCTRKDYVYFDGRCMTKGLAKKLKKDMTIDALKTLNNTLDKQREFNQRDRELDIMERDAMTPDVIQNNQQNIQQNLQQNNLWYQNY